MRYILSKEQKTKTKKTEKEIRPRIVKEILRKNE